jgi:hypothetical protein
MFSLKILHQAIILYEGLGKSLVMYWWEGWCQTWHNVWEDGALHGEAWHSLPILLVDPAFITRKWTMDSSWFCQMYSHYWTWQKSSSIFPSTEKEGEAILLGHLGISLVFPLVISLCIPSLHASKEIDSCFLLFHLLPNGIVVPVWQHNLNCSSVDTLASQNDGLR